MKYGELLDVVGSINTGAAIPDSIATITKLVLGKIARKRLPARIKLATLNTAGLNIFQLGTAAYIPDFMYIKTNGGNYNKSVYYNMATTQPYYIHLVPYSNFTEYTEGGYASLDGHTLHISYVPGAATPSQVYFQYYSKYLVLDKDGITEKETPEDNEDEFLLPSEFDDVLVDGIMLYLARREKTDTEYTKNVQEWEKRLNELVFLS